jgi:hypothetical protein
VGPAVADIFSREASEERNGADGSRTGGGDISAGVAASDHQSLLQVQGGCPRWSGGRSLQLQGGLPLFSRGKLLIQ